MNFLQWMDKGWKEKWLRVYVNHVNVRAMHCLVVYTKSWRTKLPNEWQPNACLKVLNRWIACVNKFSKLKFMSRADIKLIKTKRHRFDPSVCVFINPFCREWANDDKTEIKIQNTSSAISHFSFALGRHTIVLSEFHYLLIFLRFCFDVLCDFSLCGALLYPAHTTWTVVVTAFTLYTFLSYTELDCRNAHRDIGAMYINNIQYKYSFSVYLFRFYMMKLMVNPSNTWSELVGDRKRHKKHKRIYGSAAILFEWTILCNGKPLRFDVGRT